MDVVLIFQAACRTLLGLLFGWFVIVSYRQIRRRSLVLGRIVALGLLGRAVVGLMLFLIAFLRLPVAESLQMGNGFWTLFQDAPFYYGHAWMVMEQGLLDTDYHLVPSPFFIQTLVVWMSVLGTSPAAGLFLNLCIYAGVCLVVVRLYGPVDDWRRDLPCIVAVGAYSFSPVVFIHSTQMLKEDVFYLLILVACLGVLGICRWLVSDEPRYRNWAAVGAVAILAALPSLASVRWYFPVIIWCSLACTCLLFAFNGRSIPLWQYVARSVAVLLLVAFASGARPSRTTLVVVPSPAGTAVTPGDSNVRATDVAKVAQAARGVFLTMGGDTNIVVPLHEGGRSEPKASAQVDPTAAQTGPTAVQTDPIPVQTAPTPESPPAIPPATSNAQPVGIARAMPQSPFDHVQAVVLGLVVLLVPMSLLKGTSLVNFSGGRSLLPVADVDTILIDVVIVYFLVALWRRRHTLGDHLPFVIFGLILSCATAVLLGYVVTNYGTLVRMRPMMLIPLWALVVAMSPQAGSRLAPSAPDGIGHPRATAAT